MGASEASCLKHQKAQKQKLSQTPKKEPFAQNPNLSLPIHRRGHIFVAFALGLHRQTVFGRDPSPRMGLSVRVSDARSDFLILCVWHCAVLRGVYAVAALS